MEVRPGAIRVRRSRLRTVEWAAITKPQGVAGGVSPATRRGLSRSRPGAWSSPRRIARQSDQGAIDNLVLHGLGPPIAGLGKDREAAFLVVVSREEIQVVNGF